MVSVRNQMSEPLVDIATVKREYWNRKKVPLPSLAEFHKPQGWRRFFWKKPKPYIVIRRLTHKEWVEIDERFADIKMMLAKQMKILRGISTKMMDGGKITADEYKTIHAANREALPMFNGMLELMIDEPEMDYDDVVVMMDALDEFDRETLLAYINMLTTEKALAARAVHDKRLQEMTVAQDSILAQVRP